MDLNNACDTLGVIQPFSIVDVKRAYYKCALKYHPDKNINKDCQEKFQKISDAYNFLITYLELEVEDNYLNYNSIINNFFDLINDISVKNIDISQILIKLTSDNNENSSKTFEHVDKNTAIKIFGYIEQYAHLFGLSKSSLSYIREIIHKKLQNDILYVLNPTLHNLLSQDIYKLIHDGVPYYIPLWHDEVTYDLPDNAIIIKCIPELPKHISVDHNNNIIININFSIKNILDKKTIDIQLDDKIIQLYPEDLKIKKYQLFILKNKGIPIIDVNNFYNTKNVSDLIFHICLVD